MPSARPLLVELGARIRARRKALGVNGMAAAESAGMSRVTWYRIEKGEPTVAASAYANALAALGMACSAAVAVNGERQQQTGAPDGWLPAKVRIQDYPQLRQLAWQVHGTDFLSPREALSIYERNWRHVDVDALEARERALIAALQVAFASPSSDV